MPVQKLILSGSTSGRPIPVAAVATPGTLIHTAVAGALSKDEVYLLAANAGDAFARLTIEWGGVAQGDHINDEFALAPHSALHVLIPGNVLNGALEIRAFSDVASAINISGFVNRIT
jgi:hypothetical protein